MVLKKNFGADVVRFADFTSGAEMWIDNYEEPTFEEQLKKIDLTVRPLFEELHIYVRRALVDKYGDEVVQEEGPIPIHLLGNLWGQQWGDVSYCFLN